MRCKQQKGTPCSPQQHRVWTVHQLPNSLVACHTPDEVDLAEVMKVLTWHHVGHMVVQGCRDVWDCTAIAGLPWLVYTLLSVSHAAEGH